MSGKMSEFALPKADMKILDNPRLIINLKSVIYYFKITHQLT